MLYIICSFSLWGGTTIELIWLPMQMHLKNIIRWLGKLLSINKTSCYEENSNSTVKRWISFCIEWLNLELPSDILN